MSNSFYFRRLPKKIVHRVLLPIGVGTFGLAVYQGAKLRHEYRQRANLEAPVGPQFGFERWVERIKGLKDEMPTLPEVKEDLQLFRHRMRKLREVVEIQKALPNSVVSVFSYDGQREEEQKRIEDLKLRLTANGTNLPLEHSPVSGPIQLVVLGDSLVAGVGCKELSASPILPKVMASILSWAVKTDVRWASAGKIGATVKDLRSSVLPALKERLMIELDNSNNSDINKGEVLFVVICGLNDWRSLLERPWRGLGLLGFRRELQLLCDELSAIAASKGRRCRILLPRLPLTCLGSDPDCCLTVFPLVHVVSLLCSLWDMQKKHIALDNLEEAESYEEDMSSSSSYSSRSQGCSNSVRIYAVDSPSLDSSYAMPGKGNVSEDLVHPSDQGYAWWATHLAEQAALVLRQ